jgi:hypothetical protein
MLNKSKLLINKNTSDDEVEDDHPVSEENSAKCCFRCKRCIASFDSKYFKKFFTI